MQSDEGFAYGVSLACEAVWADSFPCGKQYDSCTNEDSGVRERQEALILALTIAVIAWVGTLTISLYRLEFTVETQRLALDLYRLILAGRNAC